MSKLIQRIKVSNDSASFVTAWLEPWGEDYGMSPGDEFEIVAAGAGEDFHFHIIYGNRDMKIYAERNAGSVSIYQNGELLLCGHNRRGEE
jgi:hypothetical protein